MSGTSAGARYAAYFRLLRPERPRRLRRPVLVAEMRFGLVGEEPAPVAQVFVSRVSYVEKSAWWSSALFLGHALLPEKHERFRRHETFEEACGVARAFMLSFVEQQAERGILVLPWDDETMDAVLS